MCAIQIRIGHECHSSWKQSVLLSRSASHMFCREVAIHDKCADQLIAMIELILEWVKQWRCHTDCILSSNPQGDWCLVVGMQDRTQPWIHQRRGCLHAQVHFAFCFECLAIGEMLWEAACIDSWPRCKCMIYLIRKRCLHTGTLSGNIRFVMLWSLE